MQTPRADAERGWRRSRRGACALALALAWASGAARPAAAQTGANITGTKHDMSKFGPGDNRALAETRICVFCHTPHNAAASSPLWNKDLEPVTYQVYTSPTLKAAQKLGTLPQPSGSTKLCLSCHDGTIALGAVLNPAGGIAMAGTGTLASSSLSNFGLDLSGHHPVSFRYTDSLPNAELASSPPSGLTYGAVDEVHCVTCHDPHDDRYGRFLAKDNRYSALCTTCHLIPGWSVSAHATSTASVAGVLPRPPANWPAYTQLNEWGCESCHTPHFAPTAEQLLIFTAGPPAFSCTSSGCHGSAPGPAHGAAPVAAVTGGTPARTGGADIAGQMRKISAHRDQPGALSSTSGETPSAARTASRTVACADCHNPHAANRAQARPPSVSGFLAGVRGVDRYGVAARPATYEYEICFKCHGDFSGDAPFVMRVVAGGNVRLAFDTNNASFHPVVGPGRSLNVPSIPSSLSPSMTVSAVIACTTCHADDGGVSRGPHGSSFRPILKERYETGDGTPESFDVYALCYRCHERTSILGDQSFQRKTARTTPSGGGHSGHLAARATCSACHDPHGVNVTGGAPPQGTGDHTRLINFSVQVVQPVPGSLAPVFRQTGTFSGSCTLVCHGVTHNAWAYP
jgi:predicted CXXCH cytochrome family protein